MSLARGLLTLAIIAVSACAPGDRLDIVLAGGWIVDGTGNPRYRADIGIRGDRIVAIGRLDEAPTR
ncbi:MAG: hypothetical protein OEO17_17200, partial [Gemmatimonadota bacterium]|nr:hypothetical protein [Gemmatimonadota bacterium]